MPNENYALDTTRLSILAGVLAMVIFVFPLAIKFPLLDPDEGLHASIAQEMVERGDWIVPHFLDKPFLDKPIFYFWCQALSLECFGMNEFAVRLPGLLLGLLGCVTTGIVGYRMFDRTTGLISGIFYGTMILPVALAQAATHDVALVPCVNLAILLFWQSDRAKSLRSSALYALVIGTILGVAILAKGLMGVALVGVAYGSYLLITRQFTLAACCRGVASLTIAAGIASIWYLAVEHRQHGFLHYYFIERHLLGFATSTQRHGDAPWWLYLPLLLGGGLPWIGYLPVTIRESLTRFRNDNASVSKEVLLWCWLLGCTLLLTIAQSKLVTYLWPVFPAIAILAAIGWARLLDGTLGTAAKQSLRKNFILSSFAGPFVLPVAVFVLQRIFGIQFSWPTWTAVMIVALATLAPLWFVFQNKWQGVLAASALAIAAQFFVIISFLVPTVADLHSKKQLAEFFNTSSSPLPTKMIFVEERIGSFVFYLTPTIRSSIQKDQLQEIERPKVMPKEKITVQPSAVVVIPKNRIRRAKGYVDLTGLTFYNAGRYFLIKDTPMKSIPETIDPVMLRIDFSDDAAWKVTCAAIKKIPSEYQEAIDQLAAFNEAIGQNGGKPQANVDFIEDPQYADITIDQLLELVPKNFNKTFIFVVDRMTIMHSEHPILVIDLYHARGRMFRAIPSQIMGIENNLSISNMDWEDFAEHVDADGIFRGFSRN